MKTAVTLSLVSQARQGPFVYHGDLAGSIRKIGALGYDAVEIFPPTADAIDSAELKKLLRENHLQLAAMGTGAGFVVQQLSLTDPNVERREAAVGFVKSIIDKAGEFGAPAIIGSMQGRHLPDEREAALAMLAESLAVLGAHARQYGVPLLYEPLNRYETNLFNRQGEAAEYLRSREIANVRILADLFHMNIEESDLAKALMDVGDLLGHVHFVDSTRRAPGWGHIDFSPIVTALREMGYRGYISAECFPHPDSDQAAKQAIDVYKQLIRDN